MHKIPHTPLKNLNEETASAMKNCANKLSLNEMSRITGVRIELLRRYINRQAKTVRAETWDRIYPVLKPYLVGPEPMVEPPPRVGAAYRRHQDLVEMVSDQKVLLDEYAILTEKQKQDFKDAMVNAGAGGQPTRFISLSRDENLMMGLFLSLDAEKRSSELLRLTEIATVEVRRRQGEMF